MRAAPVSIRRYLMLIVLSALLPMGVFAAGLLYFLWDYQQTQRNQELLARVRVMASMVEGELESTTTRLRLLASDPQLDVATLADFHQRLRDLLQQNGDWSNLLLISRERQLLNAAVPFGTPLPETGRWPYQRNAFETGRPATSDLFTARVRKGSTVAIAVPVFRDGKAEYALVAGLRLAHLGERLGSIVPSDGVAGVFDRNLKFIARTRDPDPYIGKPPGDLLLNAMRDQPEGVIRSITREGENTFTAFRRLAEGWYIGVATPSAPVDRAFSRYLAILGGAWAALLLLGMVLTRFLMARINDNVAATVETASQLAAGKPAEFSRSTVAELATISDAIRSLFQRERQARAKEEAANKTKDEFLAMLGHELRNPLAPISTALHLMRTRGGDAFPKEREIIQRQVQHMVRLVDDLLDVARIARGGVELKKLTAELSGIVSEAVETTEPLFRRKRIALSVSVPETGLKIHGDPARLVQILSNLLTNAAKFTDEQGKVVVAAAVRGATVDLTVADNGSGMARDELTQVFELFTQGQQGVDRPRGGLGLGLAIARSLARLHGGDLVAASDGPGKGSIFTLTLPRVDGPLAPRAEPDGLPPAARSDRLVLIVDDNVDAAEGLAELLKLWGYRTQVVHDGSAVIGMLQALSPDIVLLDIGLPGIDGFELASLIRQEPCWRDLLIIALTGYGQANDRDRSREAGIDMHLVKPVDIEQLARALDGPVTRSHF
jgi:signal transduction histidine kinase